MKVLITGGNGYIAKSISKYFSNFYKVISLGRDILDLTDKEAVDDFFAKQQFDVVIHTAIKGGCRLTKDTDTVFADNILMMKHLYNHREKFKKLINFGSGAETYNPESPYGSSKKWCNDLVQKTKNWSTLKLYGVFDANEKRTRFIKSNIYKYINREAQIIHQDKYMDFIYMDDLINLTNHYVISDNLPKIIECVYPEKILLSEISNIINNLDSHRVKIEIENLDKGLSYVGNGSVLKDLNLNLIGLEKGIESTYIALKK